jgi:hypothetical protein
VGAHYALLTVPAIAKTKIIDDSIDDSIPVPPAAPILNLEVGAAVKMTDKLLTKELRKVGRNDELRREREDTAQQHELAQQIKGLSRVTSGGLASLSYYCLDTNVHQAVRERVIAGEEKDKERDSNRAVAAESADARKQVAEAALQAGTKLTIENLKALILSKKRRNATLR